LATELGRAEPRGRRTEHVFVIVTIESEHEHVFVSSAGRNLTPEGSRKGVSLHGGHSVEQVFALHVSRGYG